MAIDFSKIDYLELEARVMAERSPTEGELQLIYSPKHPGDVFVKVKGSKAAFICKFYGNNEAISALQALANVDYFMECWSGYAKLKAEIKSLKAELEKARRESAVLTDPKDDAKDEKNSCQHLNLYPSMDLQMKMASCGHFLIHGDWQCQDCNKWIFLELEDEWEGRRGTKTKDGKYEFQRIDGRNTMVNIEVKSNSMADTVCFVIFGICVIIVISVALFRIITMMAKGG